MRTVTPLLLIIVFFQSVLVGEDKSAQTPSWFKRLDTDSNGVLEGVTAHSLSGVKKKQ